MEISVGTFSLNNLSPPWKFQGTIDAISDRGASPAVGIYGNVGYAEWLNRLRTLDSRKAGW